jgi:hypothetical protein
METASLFKDGLHITNYDGGRRSTKPSLVV